MNILITGGAGFIGSHTLDALIEKGHNVKVLDNISEKIHPDGIPRYLNPKAELIFGDVRERESWEKGLEGIDAVYHLAAYQDYLTDFSTYFDVNTTSTALLYEMIVEKKLNIKKVIVAASQSVMGEGKYNCKPCSKDFYPEIRSDSQLSKGKWEHYCPECNKTLKWKPSDESVVNPCNQYALSKHSQEQIAIQFGKRYNIPSTVMRYSIVQGARQSLYNAYSGAMRIFALSLFFDKQPMVFEDGNQIRDFVNIKDVVSANLKVLEDDNANYQVFNVGGGKAWTVNDFYNKMQKITKKKIKPIISKYYRFGDTRHIFSDISKLEKLGWKPKFGVKDSIKEYWDYINTGKGMEHVLDYAQRKMKNLDVIRKV